MIIPKTFIQQFDSVAIWIDPHQKEFILNPIGNKDGFTILLGIQHENVFMFSIDEHLDLLQDTFPFDRRVLETILQLKCVGWN